MEMNNALQKFDALSHEMRLKIIKFLVPYGDTGVVVQTLAEHFAIPHNTVSTHLQKLKMAGLVKSQRAGKFVYYIINFYSLNGLIDYLLDNCCAKEGTSCDALPEEFHRVNKPNLTK